MITTGDRELLGYLGVTIAVLLFASNYVGIKKLQTGNGIAFSWYMSCFGMVIGYISILLQSKPTKFIPQALVGGALAAIGNLLIIPCMKLIGLAAGFTLWTSVTICTGYMIGQFGFLEISSEQVDEPYTTACNIAGAACAVVALVLLLFVRPKDPSDTLQSRSNDSEDISDHEDTDSVVLNTPKRRQQSLAAKSRKLRRELINGGFFFTGGITFCAETIAQSEGGLFYDPPMPEQFENTQILHANRKIGNRGAHHSRTRSAADITEAALAVQRQRDSAKRKLSNAVSPSLESGSFLKRPPIEKGTIAQLNDNTAAATAVGSLSSETEPLLQNRAALAGKQAASAGSFTEGGLHIHKLQQQQEDHLFTSHSVPATSTLPEEFQTPSNSNQSRSLFSTPSESVRPVRTFITPKKNTTSTVIHSSLRRRSFLDASERDYIKNVASFPISRPRTMVMRLLSLSSVRITTGVILAAVAGLCFGFMFVPFVDWYEKASRENDISSIHPPRPIDFAFAFFSGMWLTCTGLLAVYGVFMKSQPTMVPSSVIPGFATGASWAMACIGWFYGTAYLGLSIGFVVVCVAQIIVILLWSGIVFKEISGFRNIAIVCAAVAIALLSILLLVLSRYVQDIL